MVCVTHGKMEPLVLQLVPLSVEMRMRSSGGNGGEPASVPNTYQTPSCEVGCLGLCSASVVQWCGVCVATAQVQPSAGAGVGGKGRWRWCGAVLVMVAVRCALRVGLALDAFESGVDQHH